MATTATAAARAKKPNKEWVAPIGLMEAFEEHGPHLLADTLVPLVLVLPVTGLIWATGGYFTIQGISASLPGIATFLGAEWIVRAWAALGVWQWVVPTAFTLAEVVWAPFQKFFHKWKPEHTFGKSAVFLVSGLFDWITSGLGMQAVLPTLFLPITILVSFFLTFVPEQAGIWSVKTMFSRWYLFITDAFFGRWERQIA